MTKMIKAWVVGACLVVGSGCSSSSFHTGDGGDVETRDGGVDAGSDAQEEAGCTVDTFVNCGACPEGYSETIWLRDDCTDSDGGARTTWECSRNCGTFTKCNPGLGCPDGWAEVGKVYTELCGTAATTNGLICEPQ